MAGDLLAARLAAVWHTRLLLSQAFSLESAFALLFLNQVVLTYCNVITEPQFRVLIIRQACQFYSVLSPTTSTNKPFVMEIKGEPLQTNPASAATTPNTPSTKPDSVVDLP